MKELNVICINQITSNNKIIIISILLHPIHPITFKVHQRFWSQTWPSDWILPPIVHWSKPILRSRCNESRLAECQGILIPCQNAFKNRECGKREWGFLEFGLEWDKCEKFVYEVGEKTKHHNWWKKAIYKSIVLD